MVAVHIDSAARPTFSAVRALRCLAGFGGAGLGLSILALTTGIGVPCPWRLLTSTLCPLCGGTHVGVALLHGDPAGAWAAPVIIVAAQANQVATSPCPTVVSWATGERGAGDVIRTKGTDAPGSVDVSIDGWNTGDHAIWRVVYGTLKDQDDVQITFTVTDTSSVLEGFN